MTKPHEPVDLRAAARALLAGGDAGGALALSHAALSSILAIARSPTPVYAGAEELDAAAFGRAQNGQPATRAGVRIIRLQGVLTPQGSWLSLLFGGGPGGLQGFRAELREALGSDDVDAIVLDVHSPGGVIGLVPETAAELRAARDSGKRIVASVNTMTASAAYWIAAQADEIVGTPSGFAGSIGVYMIHEDWSGWNEAQGIDPTYIYAGRYKVEGHSDAPLDDVAKAALQREVDDLYAMFVEDVAEGRGASTEDVRAGFGEGRVLPSARAVDAGLIDRVATIDDVVRELSRGGGGGAGARRASGTARKMRAEGDNHGPNATSAVAEEVRARIAELQALKPLI